MATLPVPEIQGSAACGEPGRPHRQPAGLHNSRELVASFSVEGHRPLDRWLRDAYGGSAGYFFLTTWKQGWLSRGWFGLWSDEK